MLRYSAQRRLSRTPCQTQNMLGFIAPSATCLRVQLDCPHLTNEPWRHDCVHHVPAGRRHGGLSAPQTPKNFAFSAGRKCSGTHPKAFEARRDRARWPGR